MPDRFLSGFTASTKWPQRQLAGEIED